MRSVLVHYHIFKNAGSSLDAILRESLGAAWLPWDPGPAYSAHGPQQVMQIVAAHPTVRAISSHTIRPPFPVMDETRVLPLFFLRDPILRVASVYKYERKLSGETESQRVALSSTFPEYVRWRLRPGGQPVVRNFQVVYLSGEQLRYEDPRKVVVTEEAFRRAVVLLEQAPFFGIVERFADSVRLFERCLKDEFPEIKWLEKSENTTGTQLSTLNEIRAELGEELYAELEDANRYDRRLYERANELFLERSA